MLAAALTDKLKALLPDPASRFAIAYSGGGDSTALLHALKGHPQLKAVYIVDHNLRTGSRAEAEQSRDFAKGLGLNVQILTWDNQGVTSAIQERARTARYALMSAACREAGIEYLLTGHHQDDQAETLFMRFDKNTGWRGAAGIAEMSYAPIWPQMALVTIARPLLETSRADLQTYNRQHGLSWAEDPSNDNTDFERVRARQYLAGRPHMRRDLLEAQSDMQAGLKEERLYLAKFLRDHVKINEHGIITVCELCPPQLLIHLLRAASGEGRQICRNKVARLLEFMGTARFTSATLGGALIRRNPSEKGFILCRDLVAVTGRKDNNIAPLNLHKQFTDKPQIWDGRYVFHGPSGYSLDSAHAAREQMSEMDVKRLRDHPAAVRQTLPVVMKDGEIIAIGGQEVDESGPYSLKSLIKPRLDATVGKDLTP